MGLTPPLVLPLPEEFPPSAGALPSVEPAPSELPQEAPSETRNNAAPVLDSLELIIMVAVNFVIGPDFLETERNHLGGTPLVLIADRRVSSNNPQDSRLAEPFAK
jgi:hypothetical protein